MPLPRFFVFRTRSDLARRDARKRRRRGKIKEKKFTGKTLGGERAEKNAARLGEARCLFGLARSYSFFFSFYFSVFFFRSPRYYSGCRGRCAKRARLTQFLMPQMAGHNSRLPIGRQHFSRTRDVGKHEKLRHETVRDGFSCFTRNGETRGEGWRKGRDLTWKPLFYSMRKGGSVFVPRPPLPYPTFDPIHPRFVRARMRAFRRTRSRCLSPVPFLLFFLRSAGAESVAGRIARSVSRHS